MFQCGNLFKSHNTYCKQKSSLSLILRLIVWLLVSCLFLCNNRAKANISTNNALATTSSTTGTHASSGDLLIAATVDGMYHALDGESGKVLWRLNSGKPFLSSFHTGPNSRDQSRTSHANPDQRTSKAGIIPAMDGSIFFHDEYTLQKLPYTIKELVARSPFLEEGLGEAAVVGEEQSSFVGINPSSGDLLRVFPPFKDASKKPFIEKFSSSTTQCPSGNDNRFQQSELSKEPILWFSHRHYTVRAYDQQSQLLWNFTLGEVLPPHLSFTHAPSPPWETLSGDGAIPAFDLNSPDATHDSFTRSDDFPDHIKKDERSSNRNRRTSSNNSKAKRTKRSPLKQSFSSLKLSATINGMILALDDDTGIWQWQANLDAPVVAIFRIPQQSSSAPQTHRKNSPSQKLVDSIGSYGDMTALRVAFDEVWPNRVPDQFPQQDLILQPNQLGSLSVTGNEIVPTEYGYIEGIAAADIYVGRMKNGQMFASAPRDLRPVRVYPDMSHVGSSDEERALTIFNSADLSEHRQSYNNLISDGTTTCSALPPGLTYHNDDGCHNRYTPQLLTDGSHTEDPTHENSISDRTGVFTVIMQSDDLALPTPSPSPTTENTAINMAVPDDNVDGLLGYAAAGPQLRHASSAASDSHRSNLAQNLASTSAGSDNIVHKSDDYASDTESPAVGAIGGERSERNAHPDANVQSSLWSTEGIVQQSFVEGFDAEAVARHSIDAVNHGWVDRDLTEYLQSKRASEHSGGDSIQTTRSDNEQHSTAEIASPYLMRFVIVWDIETPSSKNKRDANEGSPILPILTAAVSHRGVLHHIQIGRSAVTAAGALVEAVQAGRRNMYVAHVTLPVLLRHMLKSPWPLSNIGVWMTVSYAYLHGSGWFPRVNDDVLQSSGFSDEFVFNSDTTLLSTVKWWLGLGYYGRVEAEENPLVLSSSVIAVAITSYFIYRTVRAIKSSGAIRLIRRVRRKIFKSERHTSSLLSSDTVTHVTDDTTAHLDSAHIQDEVQDHNSQQFVTAGDESSSNHGSPTTTHEKNNPTSMITPLYRDIDGVKYQVIDELAVCERILGFGSHGTVVYAGLLEGRPVAVKKMLKSFFATADREINLLIKSDGHPHVVRYFSRREWGDFVHLALERCQCSLADAVRKCARHRMKDVQHTSRYVASDSSQGIFPPVPYPSPPTRRFLWQLVTGVNHLHRLRIVHRDLKPENILLAEASKLHDALAAQKAHGMSIGDAMSLSNADLFAMPEYYEQEHHSLGYKWQPKISDMGLGKVVVGTTTSGQIHQGSRCVGGTHDMSSHGGLLYRARARLQRQQRRKERHKAKFAKHLQHDKSNKSAASDEDSSSESDSLGSDGYTSSDSGTAPGTMGWQAPELLRRLYNNLGALETHNMDEPTQLSSSSEHMTNVSATSTELGSVGMEIRNGNESRTDWERSSRAVDVWALGCILYYVVDAGHHPFGMPFEREHNILRGKPDLRRIAHIPELQDLLFRMLDRDPRQRPRTAEILEHPFFWDDDKRSSFLQDISDRLESESSDSVLVKDIERTAPQVVGNAWNKRLPEEFLSELGRYRKYNFASVLDCLRVFRNKRNHFRDLPSHVRSHTIGGDSHLALVPFFLAPVRFPRLLLACYEHALRHLVKESHFQEYLGTATTNKYLHLSVESSPALSPSTVTIAPYKNLSTTKDEHAEIVHETKVHDEESDDVRRHSEDGIIGKIAQEQRSWYCTPDQWIEQGAQRSCRAVYNGTFIYSSISDEDLAGKRVDYKTLQRLLLPDTLLKYGSSQYVAEPDTGPRFQDESNNIIVPSIVSHDSVRNTWTRYRGGGNVAMERYKSRLCKDWTQSGGTKCSRGIRCDFAHSVVELRVRKTLEQLSDDIQRILQRTP